MRWLGLANRLPIAGLRVMIGAGNYEPGIRHFLENKRKRLHKRFKALVGSPVSDGQNALVRIAAFRKLWRRRNTGKCSVGSREHIPRGVFLSQGAVIPGEQDRDRIRFQQCASRQVRSKTEELFLPDSSGGKIDVFDNVVQSDVRVEAGSARQSWRGESRESGKRPCGRCKAGED